MSGTHQTDFMAIVSSTFSVISVGWGLAAYTRALRKAYSAESKHREMSRPAVMVNFLWVRYSTNVPDVQIKPNIRTRHQKWFQRSFEFTSRVIILVLFSYAFKLYVLIPIFGRWILMTARILTIETNYHQNAWAEKAFQMIMGFLNVFLFFNMKDGSPKDVIIIYYSLNFLEGNNHKY